MKSSTPHQLVPQERIVDKIYLIHQLVPQERIVDKIYLIRGKKVMLDRDLAELYQVETRSLNQAVKRNTDRFPDDFMFQVSEKEYIFLRSQFVILEGKGKYPKYLPYVFTEQGIAMLSSVLKSKIAIQINIQIIRTFTRLRELMSTNEMLRHKIESIERKQESYDKSLAGIFQLIEKLVEEETQPKPEIGFRVKRNEP